MLAATASAVARLKESGMLEATTVANFKVKSELQAAAAGRVIWCDEATYRGSNENRRKRGHEAFSSNVIQGTSRVRRLQSLKQALMSHPQPAR
jgi:hypothetical protein